MDDVSFKDEPRYKLTTTIPEGRMYLSALIRMSYSSMCYAAVAILLRIKVVRNCSIGDENTS